MFRALTAAGAAHWRAAATAVAELAQQGLLVQTTEVPLPPQPVREAAPRAEVFLEHAAIPLMTWPAEWTASALADAGLLTLDIQCRLVARGLSLQDATAFNVAHTGKGPIFLDVGGIVKPARLDIWYALGQFQRHFLYPLLLAHRGITPADVFLQHLDGIAAPDMARRLGRWGWLRPTLLTSVYLPAWLSGGKASAGTGPSGTNAPGGNPEVQLAILHAQQRRLRRLRRGLQHDSHWSGYRNEHSYSDADDAAKQAVVQAFAQSLHGGRLVDLGANTGRYSELAAAKGCSVIAMEGDHAAADLLYRELGGKGVQVIRANLANPTPAIGFLNRERSALLDRVRADGTMALALTHHLLVSAGLRLAQVAELLHSFAPRLLVEFVAPQDPMFRRLVTSRQDLWTDLTEPDFVAAFTARGLRQLGRTPLGSGTRVLLEFGP